MGTIIFLNSQDIIHAQSVSQFVNWKYGQSLV